MGKRTSGTLISRIRFYTEVNSKSFKKFILFPPGLIRSNFLVLEISFNRVELFLLKLTKFLQVFIAIINNIITSAKEVY